MKCFYWYFLVEMVYACLYNTFYTTRSIILRFLISSNLIQIEIMRLITTNTQYATLQFTQYFIPPK